MESIQPELLPKLPDDTINEERETAKKKTVSPCGLQRKQSQPRPWIPTDDPHQRKKTEIDYWGTLYGSVRHYDEDLCRSWKDELEKLLLSAGLFSAAITAFAIETYKWLDNPYDNKGVPLGETASHLRHDESPPPIELPPGALFVNICNFLSLTLSLSTVLLGLLCLQWIREYQRDILTNYKEELAMRQIRYRGLIAWKVPYVIVTLPLILIIALIVFFWGIIKLLWVRNLAVALVVAIPFNITIGIFILTSLGPGLQQVFINLRWNGSTTQCPYKSPQAHLFWSLAHIFCTALQGARRKLTASPSPDGKSWMQFDEQFRTYVGGSGYDVDLVQSFVWVRQHLCQSITRLYTTYECFSDLDFQTQKAIVEEARGELGESVEVAINMLDDRSTVSSYCQPTNIKRFVGARKRDLLQFLFLQPGDSQVSKGSSSVTTTLLRHWFRVMNSCSRTFEYMVQILPLSTVQKYIAEMEDHVQQAQLVEQLMIYTGNWTDQEAPHPAQISDMANIITFSLDILDYEQQTSVTSRLFVRIKARILQGDIPDGALSALASHLGQLASHAKFQNETLRALLADLVHTMCHNGSRNVDITAQGFTDQKMIVSQHTLNAFRYLLHFGITPDHNDPNPSHAHEAWFWTLLPEEYRSAIVIFPTPKVEKPQGYEIDDKENTIFVDTASSLTLPHAEFSSGGTCRPLSISSGSPIGSPTNGGHSQLSLPENRRRSDSPTASFSFLPSVSQAGCQKASSFELGLPPPVLLSPSPRKESVFSSIIGPTFSKVFTGTSSDNNG